MAETVVLKLLWMQDLQPNKWKRAKCQKSAAAITQHRRISRVFALHIAAANSS